MDIGITPKAYGVKPYQLLTQMSSIHSSLAHRLQKLEVAVLDIELHVVPVVDCDTAVRLCEVVEPERGQVEHVAGLQSTVNRPRLSRPSLPAGLGRRPVCPRHRLAIGPRLQHKRAARLLPIRRRRVELVRDPRPGTGR